jgi:pimeloyl-ACP methyl ester carboxylesterase
VRRRLVALVATATLTAAACAGDDAPDRDASPTTASPPTTAPTTTTTVQLPPPTPIAWTSCGRFDCGRITVPVDYHDPAGPTLEVAVIRRPAADPARRVGTLVMNPGGPGASGVRRVERGFTLSPEVAERFDIVGFDPRGVGQSTPITCGGAVPAFRATDLSPNSPEEQQLLEAAAKDVADECAATEGVRLAHLGTYEVVHDVEVLRRSLGEPQISFVGLSYGTLIGLFWAEAYPASVRAMVLDGVADPEEGGGVTSLEQVEALEDTFTAIAAGCEADPTCPLTVRGGLAITYDELARRLEDGAGTSVGVGPTQLTHAAFLATYGEEHWPDLWHAVDEGLDGDLSGVAAMAESFTSLVAYAPFAIVSCLDSPHPEGPETWRRDARRAARVSPRFGAVLANELLPCAYWPESRGQPHEVRAPGTPPILVLGSTGDVATPFEQARRVARELEDGVLLTIDQVGHVALGASDCAAEVATRYLVDLAVPAPGTRC